MLNYNRFYKELGNLFYAIASADGRIKPDEKERLNDEIQYSWKHFDDSTDRFGSDRAFVIQYEFDTMEEAFETPEQAYASFETYFTENEQDIDNHTRQKIFSSARHIAESFRKINATELDYMMRLKKLLNV